jgi:hypothetical protein
VLSDRFLESSHAKKCPSLAHNLDIFSPKRLRPN